MQRLNRKPYVANATFVCLKPFVMAGRQFNSGDLVPTDGIQERRTRQMYDARLIDVQSFEPPAKIQPPVKLVLPSATQYVSLKAVHKGFNRWYVVNEAGDNVIGPVDRPAAEAFVRDNPVKEVA